MSIFVAVEHVRMLSVKWLIFHLRPFSSILQFSNNIKYPFNNDIKPYQVILEDIPTCAFPLTDIQRTGMHVAQVYVSAHTLKHTHTLA